MTPMKCETIIYRSEEDQPFLAEVPALPGCMADGPTKAKALATAELVACEWIETHIKLARPIRRFGFAHSYNCGNPLLGRPLP